MKFSAIVLALMATAVSAFVPSQGFLGRVNSARASGVPALQAEAAAVTLPASVKPGVVTGPALRDLLNYAKERGFAMPGVNIVGASEQPHTSFDTRL